MNDGPATSVQNITPNPVAEPNVFLPGGRIGVCSMLFRGAICFLLLAGTGFVLRLVPESSQNLVAACIAYPAKAFMIITGIKRAHDMGYSAWGFLLLCLLPILLVLPGIKTANKYGPVPTRWL